MANRRCISTMVVESDGFYNLTDAAQSLYLHLTMLADNDGFVNCARKAAKYRTWKRALDELVEAGFLLRFDSVHVIRHWRAANSLKSDRRNELTYPDIARQIFLKKDKTYSTECNEEGESLFEAREKMLHGSKGNSKKDSKNSVRLESEKKGKEKKGKEENRKEQNGTEQKASASAVDAGEDAPNAALAGVSVFDQIYNAYPNSRKGDRHQVKKRFEELKLSPRDCQMAMENLEVWKQSSQWQAENGRYIPKLTKWLEEGLWGYAPEAPNTLCGTGHLGQAELEAIQQVLREPA